MKKLAVFLALVPALAGAQFALRDGDRVVFYGDSITDQRLYSLFTETFVRTRFPKMNVSFVHSGWGGDRVVGGGGGDIDIRLTRDVIAYRPTVVTVMLGMNDAGYRAFDQGLFDTYTKGYEHIVDRIKREVPGVRINLIIPSPYDDVTRAPNFAGGYNGTLLRYGQYISDLGRRNRATVTDMNTPVVEMLKVANTKNPTLAQRIIPDRVHPLDAGHLSMAQALLKSWNAPSLVSAVEFNFGVPEKTENTKVSNVRSALNHLEWTQLDQALPFWVDFSNPEIKLVMDSSDFMRSLNQQTLTVRGLVGRYILSIDDKPVGTFTEAELANGINLAALDTPMRAQAARTFWLTRSRAEAHNSRWRGVQTHWLFNREAVATKEKAEVMKSLDRYSLALEKEARKAAQPVPHRFKLVPAP